MLQIVFVVQPSLVHIVANASLKLADHFDQMRAGQAGLVNRIALAHPALLPRHILQIELIRPIVLYVGDRRAAGINQRNLLLKGSLIVLADLVEGEILH